MNSIPTRSFRGSLARFVLPGSLLVLGACQSGKSQLPPAPPAAAGAGQRVELASEFTATAEVTALDPVDRVVQLRREDGSMFDVQADASVRNFEQVAVGDTLRVRYKERLAAVKLPAGTSPKPAQAALGAARAPAGAKPGAGLGLAVSLHVRIESIDHERDIVVFSLASGELIAHRLQTTEGRSFAKNLAVGDLVQLDYSQGLALSVEKL
jgi:hypothetical protein